MNPNSHKRPLCSECDAYECEPDETECKDCLIANGNRKCECCEDWFEETTMHNDQNGNKICQECLVQALDQDETQRDFDRTFDR